MRVRDAHGRFVKAPPARAANGRRERQEILCHNCGRWVQFIIDLELDGNHVLNCPNCGHEHCRVVRRGVITDIRWGQTNGPTIQVAQVTWSIESVYIATSTATGTSCKFISDAWMSAGYTTS